MTQEYALAPTGIGLSSAAFEYWFGPNLLESQEPEEAEPLIKRQLGRPGIGAESQIAGQIRKLAAREHTPETLPDGVPTSPKRSGNELPVEICLYVVDQGTCTSGHP